MSQGLELKRMWHCLYLFYRYLVSACWQELFHLQWLVWLNIFFKTRQQVNCFPCMSPPIMIMAKSTLVYSLANLIHVSISWLVQYLPFREKWATTIQGRIFKLDFDISSAEPTEQRQVILLTRSDSNLFCFTFQPLVMFSCWIFSISLTYATIVWLAVPLVSSLTRYYLL